MSISYKGSLKRLEYEEAGVVVNSLLHNSQMYRKHLDDISKTAYHMFKNAKCDYNNGYILIGDYQQILRSFKSFFDRIPQPYQQALNADEILIEIKKHLPEEQQ